VSRRLRPYAALLRISLVLSLREPVALFWNVVAPAFLLFAFATTFGQIPHAIGWITAGLLCTSAMGTALFGVSSSLVNQREQRILRRFGATPLPPLAIVLSELLTGAALAAIASALQLALAAALFDLPLLDRLPALLPVLVAGLLAFMGLGLVVGTLTTSPRTALVAANALFLPLLFLGGAAIPLPILPASVQGASRLLPSRHLVEALADVLVRGAALREVALPLLSLALAAAVSIFFATVLFRFDPDEPLPARRKLAAVASLALLFAAPALAPRDDAGSEGATARAAGPASGPLALDDFARFAAFTDRIPLLLGTSDASVEVVADPQEPSRRLLHVTGRVTRDARFGGFAGANLVLGGAHAAGDAPATRSDFESLDLSGYGKLRLRVRGDGGSYRVVLATPPITDFDHLSFWFDAPSEWRTLEIPLASFAQSGFGTPRRAAPANLERTLALQFLTAGAPRTSFELWVGEVVLLP
jgi:ABC-2 type transport system permease protein